MNQEEITQNAEQKLIMARYMVHFWGIVISPILALILMVLNLRKLGSREGVLAVYVAALIYAILVIAIFFLPDFTMLQSWLANVIYTIIFVEWTWRKYVLAEDGA